MTTKEYIKKYSLDVNDKFNHTEFVQDLSSDFIALLEMNKANDNIKGFDNALRCIRMKFDAINNKTVGNISDKLWNYFYATVVVKLREALCPKDVARRNAEKERRQKEWEERNAWRNYEEQSFNDWYWERIFGSFNYLFLGGGNKKPVEAFTILGISEDADESQVKSAYKKLALTHHPDRGGKQEEFIKITDSKNKCLTYLKAEAS